MPTRKTVINIAIIEKHFGQPRNQHIRNLRYGFTISYAIRIQFNKVDVAADL